FGGLFGRDACQFELPALRVPQLQVVATADHEDSALEFAGGAERLWHQYASLLVEFRGIRAVQEAAADATAVEVPVAVLGAEAALDFLVECLLGVDLQAALGAFAEDTPADERGAVAGGDC